jgi:SAM-dependent methyltransferase
MAEASAVLQFPDQQSTQEAKSFFDQWSVYRKAVEHNYLGHREVYAALHGFLNANFLRAFSLLDFGCGDAWFMAKALDGTRITEYQGMDLSTTALRLARDNLERLDCQKRLTQDDFYQVLQRTTRTVNVIWMGLSLHHLPSAQKELFLVSCRKALRPGGCLLVYDPVLQDHEDREAFIERWWDVCQAEWTAMTATEAQQIREHVLRCDFPESPLSYREQGLRHGFRQVESLFADPRGIYQLLCFRT